jgi:hypothetical protein
VGRGGRARVRDGDGQLFQRSCGLVTELSVPAGVRVRLWGGVAGRGFAAGTDSSVNGVGCWVRVDCGLVTELSVPAGVRFGCGEGWQGAGSRRGRTALSTELGVGDRVIRPRRSEGSVVGRGGRARVCDGDGQLCQRRWVLVTELSVPAGVRVRLWGEVAGRGFATGMDSSVNAGGVLVRRAAACQGF